MYTQCPHCQTCFRIAEAHLKVANGKVRCGSCQEVFDATQHLFKNLTDREPITDFNQLSPASPPPQPAAPSSTETEHSEPAPSSFTPSPRSAPSPDTTAHNYVSPPPTPAPKTVEKVLREREKAPDQGQFMESVVGNDRYNDLDQMGAIDIPGNVNFGDSIIKFGEEPTPPSEGEQAQEARTPYEDIEDKEAPATTADHEILENFFAEVDAQLQEGGSEDGAKSQLDQDIDELLAFAKGLDSEGEPGKIKTDKPATKAPSAEEENFDLQAIADFEKELATSNPGIFTIEQPEDEPQPGKSDTDSEAGPPSESAPEFEVSAQDASATDIQPSTTDEHSQLPQDADSFEAPLAPEEDIPRALRHSLEMLEQAPRRSLGKTLLLSLLILILIGGLGFQVVLFRNVQLAHMFPKLIPALTQMCSRIPCRYSGPVDVSQIKLLNRDVRSDPNQANALLISATFVDQAPFDQPYPDIQITLYDLGGNVVASRRFTPREYLEKMYNRFLLMESGTPVHITLAVLDPGKDAINFEFSFLRQ